MNYKLNRKEKEERERSKLRDNLGRCANGNWVNVGYYKTLIGMGFTKSVAATALRQANNSLNTAVQMLQEEPELIALAAEEREKGEQGEEEVSAELVQSVVAMGFLPDMARYSKHLTIVLITHRCYFTLEMLLGPH